MVTSSRHPARSLYPDPSSVASYRKIFYQISFTRIPAHKPMPSNTTIYVCPCSLSFRLLANGSETIRPLGGRAGGHTRDYFSLLSVSARVKARVGRMCV